VRDTGCFVARRRRFGISAGSRSSTLPKPSSGSAARRNMYVSNNSRLRHRTFLPASVPACVCHHPPLTSSSSHVHKPFCGNFHSLSALLWQLPLFVCPPVATSTLCLTGASSLATLLLLLRVGPRVAPTDLGSQERQPRNQESSPKNAANIPSLPPLPPSPPPPPRRPRRR